jgi:hypothetical protein
LDYRKLKGNHALASEGAEHLAPVDFSGLPERPYGPQLCGKNLRMFTPRMAADDKMWAAINKEAPRKFPDMDISRVRRFVLNESEYNVTTTGGAAYFLGIILKTFEPAVRAFS